MNDILNFTSGRTLRPGLVNLAHLVDDVLADVGSQLRAQGIAVELDVPMDHVVRGEWTALRAAVLCLVVGAMRTMSDGGQLVVTSHVGPHGAELEIADSGPGIPETWGTHRFRSRGVFSRKTARLGLTTVERIAAAHGGYLIAQNCPEGGAAFTLHFPALPAKKAAA